MNPDTLVAIICAVAAFLLTVICIATDLAEHKEEIERNYND